MTASFETYSRYERLDPSCREIRILKLQKAGDASMMSGKLEIIRLGAFSDTSEQDYVALSRYWGAPGRHKPFVLDRHDIQIRENLHSFFVALVHRFEELWVWVDALCINQADDAEKSSQVTMMGDIYRQARHVYAWLGEGDADSDQACDFFNDETPPLQNSERADDDTLDHSPKFQAIFSRPYWERVWTLQERCLAQDLTLFCGEKVVTWENIVQKLEDPASFLDSDPSPFQSDLPENASSIQKSYLKLGKVEKANRILNLIVEFKTLRCQDPRDKVYALRELAGDGPRVPVDYTKPVLEVIFDVLSESSKGLSGSSAFSLAYPNVFEDSLRLFRCFALSERHLVSDLRRFESVYYGHTAGHPSLFSLCQWISGYLINIHQRARGMTSVKVKGGRTASYFGPANNGPALSFYIPSEVGAQDLIFPLGARVITEHSTLLDHIAAVYRFNSNGTPEFVSLIRSTTLAQEINRRRGGSDRAEYIMWNSVDRVLDKLKRLWSRGHVHVCRFSSASRLEKSQEGSQKTRRKVLRVHLSPIAVVANAAYCHGVNSWSNELPLLSAAIRQAEKNPKLCSCQEHLSQ